ncbi:trihelix transcription factor GT-3b-like [Tripterygium wilfordii]|uniref:Trihelix transcription factor GT-3b-like n=1 Tax=Tripterygium wilfordii TaxID=458696 RepID=A0A7J7DRU2_TRIWF|nr:trihelix transcription factor GT-3b-like [Tripterygium wilfordii]KAF5749122.1 trihelix transcription factor GT-3b-like [Tripterygium wilfordii]
MFGVGDGDVMGRITMIASSLLSEPLESLHGHGEMSHSPSLSVASQQLQWGQQETRYLIGIRAELESDFKAVKRNKALWEIVSSKMRERGYQRTPDQCKCKWKNLVNRYKGKETSDPEEGRPCPFFEELHAVFTQRAKNMQQSLNEPKGGSVQKKKKLKGMSGDRYSFEFSEDEDEDEDDSEEEPIRSISRKRKAEKTVTDKSTKATGASKVSNSTNGGLQELLKKFMNQQQNMEAEWREIMERRALERQLFEQEWRQSMEKLERERLMVEQAWREREEQRRIREEGRAERRDALLTTLLNKLLRENNL